MSAAMKAALQAEIERQCSIGAGKFAICADTGLWQVSADLDPDSLARAATRPDRDQVLEEAAGVVETRVAIGMKSSGSVNNALLQALPDAIRALKSTGAA